MVINFSYLTAIVDYTSDLVPHIATLNATETESCLSITATDDVYVEGTEDFRLTFEILEKNGYFSQMPGGNNVTIKIIDNDSK